MWGLLLVLALNSVRRLIEHHSAAKRSVRRTCPADDDGTPLLVPDRRTADAYLARLTAFARELDQETQCIGEDAAAGIIPPDFILERNPGPGDDAPPPRIALRSIRATISLQMRAMTNLLPTMNR